MDLTGLMERIEDLEGGNIGHLVEALQETARAAVVAELAGLVVLDAAQELQGKLQERLEAERALLETLQDTAEALKGKIQEGELEIVEKKGELEIAYLKQRQAGGGVVAPKEVVERRTRAVVEVKNAERALSALVGERRHIVQNELPAAQKRVNRFERMLEALGEVEAPPPVTLRAALERVLEAVPAG